MKKPDCWWQSCPAPKNFRDISVVNRKLPLLPVYEMLPPLQFKSVHVRLHCPVALADSNMDLFKAIDVVAIDTKCRILRGMELSFTSGHLPAKIQFRNPDGFAIHNCFASLMEYEMLEDHQQDHSEVQLEFRMVQAG